MLTMSDFFENFKKYADKKTAYHFAKKMFVMYLASDPEIKALVTVEHGNIVFDNYAYTGEMDFDNNGVHDSGLRTPELWDDLQGGYFIRWCWYQPE